VKSHCSLPIYDDYQELRPGGIEGLRSLLDAYSHHSKPFRSTHVTLPTAQGTMLSVVSFFSRRKQSASGASSGTGLPVHKQNNTRDPYGCEEVQPSAASHTNSGSQYGQPQHHFLLLCLPFMRWGTKLHQSEVCRVNSDRDFFRLLALRYRNTTTKRWLFFPSSWLLHPRSIDFVRLEVFTSSLASIQDKPALPTPVLRDEYLYEPMPCETLPPVGPNIMMHFFEHPAHAEVVPVLYRRVPKKLRARLVACPRAGSAVGWGMQMTEGLDPVLVFLCGCAAFGVALTAAVVWIVMRGDDVQGGFAIAGFVVAFVLFCVHAGGTAI